MKRRTFLSMAASGAATALLSADPMSADPILSFESVDTVKILEPVQGAVLNRRHGKVVPGGMEIRVKGTAPLGVKVTVDGVPAVRSGNSFEASIVLRENEPEIAATAEIDGRRKISRVRVVWDKNSFPRYRFSIDDNSFFLRDVTQKKYKSLFDCFYLDALRSLNREYGAKFVLNIYYTTGDDWQLTQFPSRYKSEWKDNADWLRLAFHAYANEPDRPYQDAEPAKLIADLDLVNEQIVRFAGEEVCTPPTVIHWGMTRHSAFKPLYERGVRTLSGYFRRDASGRFDVNYLWDQQRSDYLSKHDAWKDFDSGIVFSRVDIVCNNVPVDQVVPTLAPQTQNRDMAEVLDLFTHEQYFWPFYSNFVPDHVQRLDAAIRFCTEHGYKPVFYHQGLLGAPT
jgi:hypothetical protein